MDIDPRDLDRPTLNGLINGLVAPRPIAWTSTVAADGTRNLAPFSFFNAFSFHPHPTLGIGPGSRQGINKDSLANVKATGQFAVNLVSYALAERANLTSTEVGPGVDEWDLAHVRSEPCDLIRPERVADAPASFECEVLKIVELGTREQPTNSLVIGRVVRMHVADAVLVPERLTPIPEALDLVGRMGGDNWVRTRDLFELPRPGRVEGTRLRAR